MADALEALLIAGFRHPFAAANAEEGIARVRELAGAGVPAAALHEAVARAVREGLILDPVVLPEGALQCHWRLSLTKAGLARARALEAAP